jgi:hypothetical protein
VIGAIAAARGLDLTKVGSRTGVDNPPWSALTIRVVGENLVLVRHYNQLNGRRMADPQMVFCTNSLDRSWLTVSYRTDYMGVKGVATEVEHGEAVGFMPGEQLREARFADVWASNLTVQGFIEAAKTQATGT